MSKETVQFVEMVRQEYTLLEIEKLERAEILINILDAELNGEITAEEAKELRRQYVRPA